MTLVVVGAIIGVVIVVVPPLVTMVVQILRGDSVTAELWRLSSWLRYFGWDKFRIVLPTLRLPAQLDKLLESAGDTAEPQALPLAEGAIYALGQLVLMLVISVYWLTSRQPALGLLLRLSPLRHRSKVETIWTDVERALAAYVRGQALLMMVVGVMSFLGLIMLGVPYAPMLAVIGGLTEAIPIFGPLIGGFPAVLLGLTVFWKIALLVDLWYVIVQQLENHLLVPRVMQRAVGLNPILIILALIAGGLLGGVLAAVVAVPVVGAVQIVAGHVFVEPTIEKHAHANTGILVPSGDDREDDSAVGDMS